MRRAMLVPALLVCLLATACVQDREEYGPATTEQRSLEAGKAEMVSAELRMGAGRMRIRGGAEQLLEGTFEAPRGWMPNVNYRESSFRGRLTVESVSRWRFPFGRTAPTSEWDLRLNNSVPLDLNIRLGAGECDLELAGLLLRNLQAALGAGKLGVDLSGEWRRDLSVRLRGGAGEIDLVLPRAVGAVVEAKGLLGEIKSEGLRRSGDRYVNEAYGQTPVTISVDARGAIGRIKLRVAEPQQGATAAF